MFAPNRPTVRFVCYLMALITPLSPSAAVLAQSAAATDVTRYVLPYSAGVVSARPRQLLKSEAAQAFPIEVVQAAGIKALGFDVMLIDQVVFSMIPPLAGPPSYAILVELTQRIELAKLSPKLTEHTVPAKRDGQDYLQSQDPKLPSMVWVGPTTLLVAPEHSMNQLLSSQPSEPDDFAQQLKACADDDLAAIVNLSVLRPFIQLGLNQAAAEIPAEFQQYLEIPSLLKEARLRINMSGSGPMELSCAADNDASADRVSELIDNLMATYRKQASMEAAKLLQSEDPVEQAMGRYINRVTPALTEQFRPTRADDRFTIFEVANDGSTTSQLTTIAIVGTLVGLLLPAVQAAREAARKNTSMNNMKQIMLALHNHHDATGRFPAHAKYSADGKPLLSWRVTILPQLGEQALYEQFRLDEPWDSEHNRQLIPLMPEFYVDPSSPKYATEDGFTHYLAVKGEGLAFDKSERGRGFALFRDGSSNTIMVVQCNDDAAVPWTKPQDIEPSKQNPLAGLAGGFHPGVFLAGFADGHVRSISEDIDPETFYHLLTIAGREVVGLD